MFTTSEPKGQWIAPNGDLVNNQITKPNQIVSQTLTLYNDGSVKIDIDASRTDVASGAIKTYPDIQRNYKNRNVASFTKAHAKWETRVPTWFQGLEWNAAFDIWLGAWGGILGEVMVWTHHKYNGVIPPKNALEFEKVIIDGRPYTAWRRMLNPGNLADKRPYIALAMDVQMPSGEVDLVGIFRWLVQKGWLKETDMIAAIEYGIEMANTPGGPQTFWIDKFDLTDS